MNERDAEFQAATSKHEVDQLQAKWDREDREAALAKTVGQQRLDDLQRRLVTLERTVAAMPGAVGQVVGKLMKNQAGMSYGGVYDSELAYQPNVMITHAGSLWISLSPVEKAAKPGKSAAWRLVAKAGSAAGGFA